MLQKGLLGEWRVAFQMLSQHLRAMVGRDLSNCYFTSANVTVPPYMDDTNNSQFEFRRLRCEYTELHAAPSDMKWAHVPRILEGSMPGGSTLKAYTTGEKECTVEDTFLEVLEGVFTRNFRNVTEMEAVMRVGAIVLCAVKDLDVVVQLHPSVTNHRTFTDFLFVMKKH